MTRPSSTAPAERAAVVGPWERSARFWLRAYPRRWRAVRGEELLGVLADLARPGATRLGARAAADLVRGGWATRWRLHPPVHLWLGYRLFNVRLPREYRSWAYDDITGALYPLRASVPSLTYLLVLMLIRGSLPDTGWLIAFAALLGLLWGLPDVYHRRQPLLRHVAPEPGERFFHGQLVVADGPRRRVTAGSGLRALIAASAAVVIAAGAAVVVAAVTDADGLPALALMAVPLALVAGWRAVRGLRRVQPWVGSQPHRELRVARPWRLVHVAACTAAAAVPLVLEATGGLDLFLAPAVLVLGVPVLTVAVVCLAVTPREARDAAALVDVCRAAVLGSAPRPDAPLPVLVAATARLRDGVVVESRPFGGPPTTATA